MAATKKRSNKKGPTAAEAEVATLRAELSKMGDALSAARGQALNAIFLELENLARRAIGGEIREQELAKKWREKVASLNSELEALRAGRETSCPCPVGHCRRLSNHIMRNTCWTQWALSSRPAPLIRALLEGSQQQITGLDPGTATISVDDPEEKTE